MFELQPFKRGHMSKRDFFTNFFDNIFDEDFNPAGVFGSSFKVDVCENEKNYMVEADLPGFKKEDVAVSYKDNYLTIKAKREEEIREEKGSYIRQERSKGEVMRRFFVEDVKEEGIDAEFANGVLKIMLPKKEKVAAEKKVIQIK
ncbi:MAG: Hsp20/alpha crystallin family protein [Acidaminococcaceae bacterium]|nr:Hsp20/alpha crystallin family protein [Acidaminococcaceae bacterium]